nr:hypothetical protein CFP56_01042 [Quercus suber]
MRKNGWTHTGRDVGALRQSSNSERDDDETGGMHDDRYEEVWTGASSDQQTSGQEGGEVGRVFTLSARVFRRGDMGRGGAYSTWQSRPGQRLSCIRVVQDDQPQGHRLKRDCAAHTGTVPGRPTTAAHAGGGVAAVISLLSEPVPASVCSLHMYLPVHDAGFAI